ncbi:MAG: CPBP family intramembrane metalloprotease [Oceanicaulis sp.]|uniref:CPBP family intramembrane glutamic endopeptidase n=1 Tax=Glycocaulis sp. TaxID=1969725 RepID=UPI0025BCFCF0|nr:type II CAAX endopeptidase family protein [Glycocaulis sp.]MCC5980818.1 CPBP family intramembrane metalloprotease [Oceanicaulis sp.]MCH8521305.1 CPBP family intramembrane metalloprotease [Glycocaulis sp.]
MRGMEPAEPVVPGWPALYAPWEHGSRRTFGWATLPLLFIAYVISAIPMVVLAAGAVISAGIDPDAPAQAGEAAMRGEILLPGILMQFTLWGVLTLVWVKAFERRSFASAGFVMPGWAVRYLRGLAVGVGLVLMLGAVMGVLGALSPGAIPEAMRDFSVPDGADWSVLLGGAFLGFAAFALITFLIQGGAEEVIFRGWLMSTLHARWGAVAAVLVSSVIFGAFHIHVMSSGIVYGILALAGITATGVFFAIYAYAERSIWGPMAAHGTFNAAATIVPLSVMQAGEPERAPADLFADVLTRATGLAGAEATEVGPHLLVQPVVFLVLSGALLLMIRARKG